MYIDLTGLEGFIYRKQQNAYAFVENGVMRIVGNVSYEKVTFCACYQKHGLVCAYCGESLSKSSKTIDHKFPKTYGGISLLDNLVPACQKCNEEKSNLFFDEYKEMRRIQDKDEKKRFRLACTTRHEMEVKKRGFCLPDEWIERETQIILADFNFTEDYRSSRYIQIEEFFSRTGMLPRPILTSENNRLLDGFNVLMFAKNERLSKVPVVKIKNLIVE